MARRIVIVLPQPHPDEQPNGETRQPELRDFLAQAYEIIARFGLVSPDVVSPDGSVSPDGAYFAPVTSRRYASREMRLSRFSRSAEG